MKRKVLRCCTLLVSQHSSQKVPGLGVHSHITGKATSPRSMHVSERSGAYRKVHTRHSGWNAGIWAKALTRFVWTLLIKAVKYGALDLRLFSFRYLLVQLPLVRFRKRETVCRTNLGSPVPVMRCQGSRCAKIPAWKGDPSRTGQFFKLLGNKSHQTPYALTLARAVALLRPKYQARPCTGMMCILKPAEESRIDASGPKPASTCYSAECSALHNRCMPIHMPRQLREHLSRQIDTMSREKKI
ncbi:hypothetical protein LX36DRAFT_282246 [Colletotrichum falcatum]|nr:hypothetical protein LX36DRAFT_282246 [Colletotrichum falcatum]